MSATWCRQCEGSCGLLVEARGREVVEVQGDPHNPVSAGFMCQAAHAWAEQVHGERIHQALRRTTSGLEPATIQEVVQDAGAALGRVLRQHGPGSVGVLVGSGASQLDAVRALAVSMSMGAPGLYTPLARWAGPMLYATGRVLGYPAALLADVGRADVVLLLGGDQPLGAWGPAQAGTSWLSALASARARGARLYVAGTRRAGLDAEVLPIRPGTGTWLLLGLCHAIIAAGLESTDYLHQHTQGLEVLRGHLSPFTPQVVAQVCGVEAEAVSKLALRLARAPRAVVARDPSLMLAPHATVGSWALLVLHALTANLLRPGGLYESPGLVDLRPLLHRASPAGARESTGTRPLLAQLPETAMLEAIAQGELKALVSVGADPQRHLPGPVAEVLAQLEVLVCMDAVPRDLHAHATWVLPAPHALERSELHLLDTSTLPGRFSQHTRAVLPGVAPSHELLARLVRAARPPLSWGTSWLPLRLVARGLAIAPLEPWVRRLWRTITGVPLWQLQEAEHGLSLGPDDRSAWRVSSGRLRLAPDEIIAELSSIQAPQAPPDRPLWLGIRAAAAWERPTVEVHPRTAARLGLEVGQEVVVRGPAGQARVVLGTDPALREDAAVLPGAWGRGPHPQASAGPLAGILHPDQRDVHTGAPVTVGVHVAVRLA